MISLNQNIFYFEYSIYISKQGEIRVSDRWLILPNTFKWIWACIPNDPCTGMCNSITLIFLCLLQSKADIIFRIVADYLNINDHLFIFFLLFITFLETWDSRVMLSPFLWGSLFSTFWKAIKSLISVSNLYHMPNSKIIAKHWNM